MIEVWTDGLCEPINPGGTGCASYILKKNGKVVQQGSETLGTSKDMTNNVAEYSALIRALQAIGKLGLDKEKILLRSDSKLLVSQMKGEWKVKGARIMPLYATAKELAKRLDINFQWVPREENVEADSLCRLAYDSAI
jgi:ribonuclease HI